MEPRIADPGPGEPYRQPGQDLAGLATFTVDTQGRVARWTVAAARLFGAAARSVVGLDACDALMPTAAHGEVLRAGLAQAAAGQVWHGTLPMVLAGGGSVELRCEPLAELGAGALVIGQRVIRQATQGLLSEAAARIGTTLDITQTAREAVEVTVPGFADCATIFVPERMLAADEPTAPRRPGRETVVRRLVTLLAGLSPAETDRLLEPGEVIVLSVESASSRAMESGAAVVETRLDGTTVERIGRSPVIRQIASGYGSFLAVPLIARGTVVGCLAFARSALFPQFTRDDVDVASQLAARAALCIDNARMYHRERRIALALQRGLLPAKPAVPPGLEVAGYYLPVGANVVGGDWHDILALPDGRAALIVGDAMGHGPEAAAIMVQLRTAAHTLADLGLPPEAVLRRLDRLAAGMPVTAFATCICAIINPADGSAAIAKAGHHPPVLVNADGSTEMVELPAGLPLGLGVETFESTPVSLPPGATIAFYTDGLVESRTQPLDTGLAAMREELGRVLAKPAAGEGLAGACELVTQTLRAHGEDDITLVLARIPG